MKKTLLILTIALSFVGLLSIKAIAETEQTVKEPAGGAE